MASLVCGWLGQASGVQEALRAAPAAGGRAGGAAAPAGARGSGAGGPPAPGAAAGAAAAAAPDEFDFLAALVKDSFDDGRMQRALLAGGARPAWLEALVADPRGRRLLYELAEAHPEALLLEMALQRLLKRGHIDEVAESGGALAAAFPVFNRLLVRRIAAVLTAPGPEEAGARAADLYRRCAAGQHAYAYAQALLAELARRCAGDAVAAGAVRRLARGLEMHAAEKQPAAWGMRALFLQPGAPEHAILAATLVGAAAPPTSLFRWLARRRRANGAVSACGSC